MSQAGTFGTTGGTPVIPDYVVEKIQVDTTDPTVTSITQPSPTQVTASSNVIIANGTNGIETVALPNVSSNAFQIRFINGTVQTVGAVTATVLTIPTVTNSVMTAQFLIAGQSNDTPIQGVGGYTTASVLNVAGTATIMGTPEIVVQTSAPTMSSATFTVSTSGSNLIVQVKGVAGKTITWEAIAPGIVSS